MVNMGGHPLMGEGILLDADWTGQRFETIPIKYRPLQVKRHPKRMP
ncbi:hypothetical protein IFT92_06065 [Peribacillus simplex]|nr:MULTISPECIES: hypothetical protein [Bacillaceae]MBD8587373.1 hypothetical protein [Peribacillus simplex]MCF7621711.1 hypothetical protein [Peribacillus frigoritolerans]MCP1093004.1 hypothetical protein [Bacillaceae bacterium OS4b]MEA3572800.1 hypothetical protein [Peribacillus frigoritolerans]